MTKKGRFCIGNRVGFVGWMVVGSVFFLHTPISKLTVDPSYASSRLAPLGTKGRLHIKQ